MKNFSVVRWLLRSGATGLFLVPTLAFAQTVSPGAINISQYIIDILIPAFNGLLLPVASVAVVILSMTLLMSTDEGALGKARTGIGIVLTGIVLAELSPIMIRIFYYNQSGSSSFLGTGIIVNAWEVYDEINGFAGFLEAFAVIVAVGVIIGSCLRAIASFGDEGSYSNARRSLFHALMGLIILVAIPAIERVLVVDRTPNAVLIFIFAIFQFILTFLSILLVGVIIFAGVLLILSFMNEGNIDRSKGIVLRALVGLILVLFSLSLVQFVLEVFGA